MPHRQAVSASLPGPHKQEEDKTAVKHTFWRSTQIVVRAVSVMSGLAHVRAAFIWGRSISPSAVLSAAVKRAVRVPRLTVTLF